MFVIWLALSMVTVDCVHLEGPDKLIVVVCSGFQYKYLDRADDMHIATPTFDLLREKGAYAHHMKPVYPTMTFPNLWTLMTGLSVEHHGLVHDNFRDSRLAKTFNGKETPYTDFYNNGTSRGGGESIWITNQNYGNHSAVSVWPAGGRTVLEGRLATYTQHVDYTITWKERIDFVVRHFTHEFASANFGLIFFEQPGEETSLLLSKLPKLPSLFKCLTIWEAIRKYTLDHSLY